MASLAHLEVVRPTDWQEHGRCRGMATDLFFPPPEVEHRAAREARERRAKEICAGCPVRLECLEWALEIREPFGVWGGYSESERRQILRGEREAV